MQCQEYGERKAKAKQKAGLILAPLNAALQGTPPVTAKVGAVVERPRGGIWITEKQPTLPSVPRAVLGLSTAGEGLSAPELAGSWICRGAGAYTMQILDRETEGCSPLFFPLAPKLPQQESGMW